MVEAAYNYKAFAADEKEVYYGGGGGGYLYLGTTNLYATIDAVPGPYPLEAALADVPVRAVTFGAPRVGDALIKDRHVDVVSLVVKQDHRYVQVTEKVVELVVDDDVVGMSPLKLLSASHSSTCTCSGACATTGQAFTARMAPMPVARWRRRGRTSGRRWRRRLTAVRLNLVIYCVSSD
ncbi:hypothetical protein OsJ_11630 [Oryza sativa Japonica Group]|uniref:Uncharacterized protein n=1 Tax=Oryza sativa subsp. japonica TaxID=39947 RepID=B9F9J8_ORYSJ|nr:hypothetical protein OsJ_11630 [Oryza sativa Japonica Group]